MFRRKLNTVWSLMAVSLFAGCASLQVQRDDNPGARIDAVVTPAPTSMVQLERVAATPEVVFDAAVAKLAQEGFTLDAAQEGARYSIKATKPYAETGCEELQKEEGEWTLLVDVNPPDFPSIADRVTLMLSYEETKAILDARKAEGGGEFMEDCLSNLVYQIAESIDEAATETGS